MNIGKKLIFLICGILLLNEIYSQDARKENFTIYVPISRYNKKVTKFIENRSNFNYYKFLGNYYIDREKKGTVNFENVDEGLEKLFPSKYDSGFLCINLENKLYQNVRNYPKNHPLFEKGLLGLKNLVNYVKLQRPDIKVGIYGIPFNFYWESQEERNEKDKLDPLLCMVDYISPSLYIHYPDFQRGNYSNLEYIKKNLKTALAYGKRLNKPVIPYVWYLIHPANKRYGKQLISKQAMANYLRLIRSFEHKGETTSGVIWWEPSKTEYKIPKSLQGKVDLHLTKDDIFLEYMIFFFKE